MKYSSDNGSTWKEVTFPDGNYIYSDISNYISNYLESQNEDKTGIQIYYVSSLKKCLIELKENFRVDFRSNLTVGALIGYDSMITSSSYGTLTPNITKSIDKIIIRCSLLSNAFLNGNRNDSVLYTFDTSNMRIGYSFKIEQRNLKYYQINTNLIREIKFEILDGIGRRVDLKDPILMVLFLRSFELIILYSI